MNHRILAFGKPALGYAKEGIALYEKRLKPYAPTKIEYLRDCPEPKRTARHLDASKGTLRIVLDERGESPTSAQFAKRLEKWQLDAHREVTYLIGAADGHTEALRAEADMIWALSPLTLQHELALVVLLEQLYRAHTILRGEPYHR